MYSNSLGYVGAVFLTGLRHDWSACEMSTIDNIQYPLCFACMYNNNLMVSFHCCYDSMRLGIVSAENIPPNHRNYYHHITVERELGRCWAVLRYHVLPVASAVSGAANMMVSSYDLVTGHHTNHGSIRILSPFIRENSFLLHVMFHCNDLTVTTAN